MGESRTKSQENAESFRAGWYMVRGQVFHLSREGVVQKAVLMRGGRERDPAAVEAVQAAARETEERERAEMKALMAQMEEAGKLAPAAPEPEAVPDPSAPRPVPPHASGGGLAPQTPEEVISGIAREVVRSQGA